MKTRHIIILTFLLMGLFVHAEDKHEPPIKHVTVFANGAQVERSQSLNLTAGEQVITFTGLSPYADTKSLQLRARGKLTVIGVNYRKAHPDSVKHVRILKEAQQKVKAADDKIHQLQAEREVVESQLEMVKTNCSVGNRTAATPLAGIKELNTYYSQELLALKKKIISIDEELQKVNEERDADGDKVYSKARDAAPETVKGDDVAHQFNHLGPSHQRQLQDIEKMQAGSPKIAEYVKNTPHDKQGWEAMRLAAEKSPSSVLFMRENIRSTLIADAVKRDPLIVKDLAKPPLDIQFEAVKANPYTIYLINNPHANVIKEAEKRLDFEGIGITKIGNLMKPQEKGAMSDRRKVELAAGNGVKLPVKGVDRSLLKMASREVLHKTDINEVLASANKMAKADRAGNGQETPFKSGQNFNR